MYCASAMRGGIIGRLEAVLLILGALVSCVQLQRDGGYDVLDSVLLGYDTLHTRHLTHTLTEHTHTRRVQFSSLGRHFELHLSPSTRFADNFAAYSENPRGELERFHVNTNEFYHGYVHGEEGSRVTAHLSRSGVLSALIATHNETYHIEPSSRYLTTPHTFHMVAYKASQVRDRLKSAPLDYIVAPSIPVPDLYMDKSRFHSTSDLFDSGRLKRQSGQRLSSESSCSMLLVADYTLFDLLKDRESVANYMVQLVLAVDSEIYRPTEWIFDSSTQNNLGLFIKKVMVHTRPNVTASHYNVEGNIEANELLSRMRLCDWSEYCLAHLFVDRTFDSGLLGLANIASPSHSQTGGVCSRRFQDNGFPGAPFVIYNTGLTTLRNRGQLMLMSELVRVTGHELGHNWGSHHDPSTSTCGEEWLMNQFAQDGSNPRHTMFSSCSRTSIGRVLLSKAQLCFVAPITTHCGDYRVTEKEQCDVGETDSDLCCNRNCTFKNSAVCSNVNSACCSGCQVAPNTTVCRLERDVSFDCVTNTFCNGVDTSCPTSPRAPEGSPCINGVCSVDGNCTELCETVNMTRCVCGGKEECFLCCENSGGVCSPLQLTNTIIPLSDGAFCTVGICVNGSCSINTQDEISRIWQIIITLDVNAFGVFLSENIVGFVLFFTLLLWCPLSCSIHYCYDRPLWNKYVGEGNEGTDNMGAWFNERIVTYNKAMEATSREQSQGPGIVSEEEPLLPSPPPLYPSSPVDDGPAPTYAS